MDHKFDLPVYPVVLFSYDYPLTAAENVYRVELPHWQTLVFQFKAIQLNQLNWRHFLRKPNPVASALMTRMRIAPEDRPKLKLECLRMLVTLKLKPAHSALIGTFMENYLKLNSQEQLVYNRELQAISPQEQEQMMT